MFLRFGKIPHDERSVNYRNWSEDDHYECDRLMREGLTFYAAVRVIGWFEIGVSVFDTENPTEDSRLSAKARICQQEPCFIVEGNVIGTGADGEPLLTNVKIVREIADSNEAMHILKNTIQKKAEHCVSAFSFCTVAVYV